MSQMLKVRIEEVLLGGVLGAGVGLTCASPLALLAGPLPGIMQASLAGESLPATIAHAVMICGALVGAGIGASLASRQTVVQHVRGSRYYQTPRQARAVFRASERANMSDAQRAGRVPTLMIGGVPISRKSENGHLYVVGLPGAGKTVVLTSLIRNALERSDRVIIHDPKGEFTSIFYDPADTILLGPWDDRCAIWDAAGDIDTAAAAMEFANAICRVETSDKNFHFHSGAANILSGLIISFMRVGDARWTWAQIAHELAGDPIALVQRAVVGQPLVRSSMPSVFAPCKPGKQPHLSDGEKNVIATLANCVLMIMQLGAVDQLKPDALRFSIRRWLMGTAHQEIRKVILNSNSQFERAQTEIWGQILKTTAGTIEHDVKKSPADGAGIWFFIDEAPQVGKLAISRLQKISEVGRSKGIRVVWATQDESQWAAVLGREAAAPVVAIQTVRVYLAMASASAREIVERIGTREVERIQNTASGGAVQGKTRGLGEQVPVLTTDDFKNLRQDKRGIEGLLEIRGTLGKLILSYGPHMREIAAENVPCQAWSDACLPEQLGALALQQDAPSQTQDNLKHEDSDRALEDLFRSPRDDADCDPDGLDRNILDLE